MLHTNARLGRENVEKSGDTVRVSIPVSEKYPLTIFHTTYTETGVVTLEYDPDAGLWSTPGGEGISGHQTPQDLLRALSREVIYPTDLNVEVHPTGNSDGDSRSWYTSHSLVPESIRSGYVLYDAMVSSYAPIIAHGTVLYGEVGFARANSRHLRYGSNVAPWYIVAPHLQSKLADSDVPPEILRLVAADTESLDWVHPVRA